MRYAACVEYHGAHFSGWQSQKHAVRTVQGCIESALGKVADEPIKVVTAGRTDTGVHASHQIIHFDSQAERSCHAWLKGGNRFLDHDVRLRWVEMVDEDFHARFSALSRSYRYIIYNKPVNSALFEKLATFAYRPLNTKSMALASQALLGEHDFSSFRAAGCQAHSPIRTVSHFQLQSKGEWIWFDITANAFLQHMVRNIAGVLIDIGSGKYPVEWINEVLQAKDRTKAAITASPSGLYLVGVDYPQPFVLPSKEKMISFWS